MDDIIKYGYYISGNEIAILSKDVETGFYLTPKDDDDSAVMVEYTRQSQVITDELDEIEVDYSTERAILFYVKMRMYEDMGRSDLAQENKGQFYKYISKSSNDRIGTHRVTIPTGIGVLK